MATVANLSPVEFRAWQEHFHRYPVDGVERLLSMIVCLLSGKEIPDWKVRPWAYSDREIAKLQAGEGSDSDIAPATQQTEVSNPGMTPATQQTEVSNPGMTPATQTMLNNMFRGVRHG